MNGRFARARQAATQLDSADQVQTRGARERYGLVISGECVMVSDGQRLQMHAPGGFHELGRRAGTVGFVGMGVKVDQAESLPYQFGYRQFPKENREQKQLFRLGRTMDEG
jgi:hypothetical protein